FHVTGVQTCALPISPTPHRSDTRSRDPSTPTARAADERRHRSARARRRTAARDPTPRWPSPDRRRVRARSHQARARSGVPQRPAPAGPLRRRRREVRTSHLLGSKNFNTRTLAHLSKNVNTCQTGLMSLPMTVETTGCCVPRVTSPLTAEDAERAARVFKALGDPARVMLLSLISGSEGGEACICDLTEPVGLSQA